MRIGVMGGTGPAGSGLAVRLAAAGYAVQVGSRELARAKTTVDDLVARWPNLAGGLTPGENASVAEDAELVFLATQWEGLVSTAESHAAALAGKIVVSIGNALEKTARGFACLVPEHGSLAVEVQRVAPAARVVAAFQHIPARDLGRLDLTLEGDVLMASDDGAAAGVVAELVAAIPALRPVDAGPLANAAGIEGLTAALVTVNVRERTRSTVKLLGL